MIITLDDFAENLEELSEDDFDAWLATAENGTEIADEYAELFAPPPLHVVEAIAAGVPTAIAYRLHDDAELLERLAKAAHLMVQPPSPSSFAEKEEDTGDRYSQEARAEAGPIVDRWVEQIREQAGEAADLADLAERIEGLYPGLNGDRLYEIMAEAHTAASLAGYVEAGADSEAVSG